MVTQAEQPNAGETVQTSLEHAISRSLASMRQAAADAGTDDFWENWTKEVMDRRPLVFVTALLDGQTFAWLMEPQDGAEHDGILRTAAHHRPGTPDLGAVECEHKTMASETIIHGVNWLVRDLVGESLVD